MTHGFVTEHGLRLGKRKPILALDFDGVLYSYTSGWLGPINIPDPPTRGAVGFCREAMHHFTLFVCSTRCALPSGTEAILAWLAKWEFPAGMYVSKDGVKPLAMITIDDRAWRFSGTWPSPDDLVKFEPWHMKEASECQNS